MTEKEKKLQEERRLLQEQAKAEKEERERIKAQVRNILLNQNLSCFGYL